MIKNNYLPLIYSCSGCSQVAQLANQIAVHLDRTGKAEMSCIAGIGGGVKPLVRKAQSGRPIIAIDGCPLECVKHSLATISVAANQYILLSEFGLKKFCQSEYTEEKLQEICDYIEREIIPALPSKNA